METVGPKRGSPLLPDKRKNDGVAGRVGFIENTREPFFVFFEQGQDNERCHIYVKNTRGGVAQNTPATPDHLKRDLSGRPDTRSRTGQKPRQILALGLALGTENVDFIGNYRTWKRNAASFPPQILRQHMRQPMLTDILTRARLKDFILK